MNIARISRFHLRRLAVWLLAAGLLIPLPWHGASAAETPESARDAAVRRKLMTIIIPRLEFREASFREAVDFLKQKSVSLDPDRAPSKRGMNIELRMECAAPPGAQAPQAPPLGTIPGLVGPAGTPPGSPPAPLPAVDPDELRITLSLRNIPLWEALRYVCAMAHLTMTVGERGLELGPEDKAAALAKQAMPAKSRASAPEAGTTAAKLKKVVIPKFEMREASVNETLDFLRIKDPGGESGLGQHGVNIVYVPSLPSARVEPPPELTFAMSNATLGEVLRRIADSARLDLAVEEYAVVLRARAARP